jgi:hypothetical protein
MAIRGRKPTATVLRLITGSHLKDRPPPADEPRPDGPVERPEKMSKGAHRLWDKWIVRAFWLTWAESPKALMWCYLQAEFEKSGGKMVAARIAQLRALGSELGLDMGSRARRTPADGKGKKEDPSKKYF